jgi:hypothetical protein
MRSCVRVRVVRGVSAWLGCVVAFRFLNSQAPQQPAQQHTKYQPAQRASQQPSRRLSCPARSLEGRGRPRQRAPPAPTTSGRRGVLTCAESPRRAQSRLLNVLGGAGARPRRRAERRAGACRTRKLNVEHAKRVGSSSDTMPWRAAQRLTSAGSGAIRLPHPERAR